MSEVEPISFDQIECGRKIAETKKRFKWRFRINGRAYLLELVNSALSGKRIISLDSMELYNEQSFLNYDFVFSHIIDGHTFRITHIPDNINKYQLRVDNQSFQEMLENNKLGIGSKKKESNYSKVQNDPFSEFGNFVNNSKPTDKNNNQFGEFDFDSFGNNPQAKAQQVNKEVKPMEEIIDPFIIGNTKNTNAPNAANYETVNFQTNTFQTNNFGNFAQNFKKAEANLLDQDNFATNTYEQNNLYNDLINIKMQQRPQYWDEDYLKAQKEKQPGFFDKFEIEMTTKQAMNKVKKAAESLKNKVTGYDDSLI